MIEVRNAPPEHHQWIATRANVVIAANTHVIEAVNGDQILAMVAYDGWTPNSCCMHVAIESPIAVRRLIRPAFWFPFVQWKKGVVLGAVLSNNEKALKLDLHLGFRQVAFIRDGWADGIGMHILEMRREDCRWLKE